jgi:pescadillo protein
VLSAAQKVKKEAKLKSDLQKEQQEMGKMMMTQRQRKLYQKAEETRKTKVQASKQLREKKKNIAKNKK